MNKIAILDLGSQYAHLIARRIRNLGVYSEILDNETKATELRNYKGIILSGGPNSVYEKSSPKVDPDIFQLNIPILGICYGHQLITQILGGKVDIGHGIGAEFGKAEILIRNNCGILRNFKINEASQVWMSHGDKVTELPNDFEIMASSKDDMYSVVGNLNKNIYGLQFHPEVVHTEKGNQIYGNFLDICEAKKDWTTKSFIEQITKEIQKQVGNRKVFMLVSGGVDSSVAYSLLVKALGQSRVKGYLIDTGLMRKNECSDVQKMLKKANINIKIENAKDDFLSNLQNPSANSKGSSPVVDPEEKRKWIGETFLDIQMKISERENLEPKHWLLGQGTIYPDTIESGGTKHANVIKTHHNRIERIQRMVEKGLVIEPIKELYKDEVRKVGLELGLPKNLIQRQPFPGPGLGVRILCNSNFSAPAGTTPVRQFFGEKRIDFEQLSQDINKFIKQEFKSQLKAVALEIRSVGVQGDFRTYKYPVCLYGNVKNWENLSKISPAITNKFSDINRVVYLIAPKEINIQKCHLTSGWITEDRIRTLQKADYLSRRWLDKIDTSRQVWQMPVVLLPLSVNSKADFNELLDIRKNKKLKKGNESIVLRPVVSEEAMTANFAEISIHEVKNLASKIMKDEQISAVFYDITNKPPGTIEWE